MYLQQTEKDKQLLQPAEYQSVQHNILLPTCDDASVKQTRLPLRWFLFLLFAPFSKLCTWRLRPWNVTKETYTLPLDLCQSGLHSPYSDLICTPPPVSAQPVLKCHNTPNAGRVKWWGTTGMQSLSFFLSFFVHLLFSRHYKELRQWASLIIRFFFFQCAPPTCGALGDHLYSLLRAGPDIKSLKV